MPLRRAPLPPIVVMGPAGAGKSVLAARLAVALGVPCAEGDDLHPAANIAKMSAGIALGDADRGPWLTAVGAWLAGHGQGGVITCSALKHRYRERLRAVAPGVLFVAPVVPRTELARRLAARRGHFMASGLLDSQLADLEPPAAGEPVLVVDGTGDPQTVLARVCAALDQPR